MTDDVELLDFEALGGVQADALSASVAGRSPYNGSMPWLVELHVHLAVIDDEFVVSLRKPGGDEVGAVSSPHGFPRDAAICRGVATVLALDAHDTVGELTSELANFGYRFIARPTGSPRGFTEELIVVADPISELTAALELGAEPAYLLDLLDGGADPMRPHVKFGRPYQVARLKAAGVRPDYAPVVEYMRACGASG